VKGIMIELTLNFFL